MTGNIHSIETLGAVDGPGLRTVVFLQGCPLRCAYCHNPDTWTGTGERMEVEQVLNRVRRCRPYYGRRGGVTLSGGEPLAQPRFAADLLRRCRDEGVHTAVDTSGACLNEAVEQALAYTDLVLLDLKHTDPRQYHTLTGGDLSQPLAFLEYLKQTAKPLWVRQVIVPGSNDRPEDAQALADLLRDVPTLERVELLPYHAMGASKWRTLGLQSPLQGVPPATRASVEALEQQVRHELRLRDRPLRATGRT